MDRVLLSSVYFFQEGPGVRKWQFRDKGIKLLNGGNINNGKLDLSSTSIYLSEEEVENKYKHFLIDDGDLLIACSGIVVENFHNKIAFASKENLPLCLNTSTMRFKSLDKNHADLKYLKYFLQTRDFKLQIGKLITGSAQLNFGPSHIKQIYLPLPDLATQKAIAAKLDKADEIRQLNKKLIAQYDVLTQSLFLDMFGDPVKNEKGWEKGTIRELCSSVKYGTSEKASSVGKFPYLRMNNITYGGYIDTTDLKYIDIKEEEVDKYSVRKGDILFNRTNSKELVGKTGLIKDETNYIIAGYLIRVRTNEKANPYFIWAYLNSKWMKKSLENMCKNIVGMANINAQELQNIPIYIPPTILQNEFAERVKAIEAQKALAQQALQQSENLFNSLLQESFQ